MNGPGGTPFPPADLAKRTLRDTILTPTATLWRIHPAGRNPVFFGDDGKNRFDSSGLGICYAAANADGAFVETFGRGEPIDDAVLKARAISRLRVREEAKLVQLYGEGLAPIGATAEVTSTRDYSLSQSWATALRAHPQRPDGIAYYVSHDNSQIGYAFYERKGLLEPIGDPVMVADFSRLWELIDKYELRYHPRSD